jgi:hypothetical protein
MATKKDIKALLKELNLTESDMQNFWNELIETNGIVKSLNKSGKNWNDIPIHLIRQLPTQRQKDLDAAEKKKKEEEETKERELKELKEKQYYENHFEEIMVDKIDKKEKLTERELQRLVDYEIEREEGEDRRWTRSISSIIKINGRTFCINWDKGLTEYQDNVYDEQPYEVKQHRYEKKIIVTEWVAK